MFTSVPTKARNTINFPPTVPVQDLHDDDKERRRWHKQQGTHVVRSVEPNPGGSVATKQRAASRTLISAELIKLY